MTINELKEGKIYWANNPQNYEKGYIFTFSEISYTNSIRTNNCINVGKMSIILENKFHNDAHLQNLRPATQQEKDWLQESIKLGKLAEFPVIKEQTFLIF